MAWGLGWIAVGRSSGSPESLVVALFAAVAAIVVLAVVPWARALQRLPSGLAVRSAPTR